MTSADDRLQILLLDYEMARDDERSLVGVQATLFGAAIALVGLIFAGLTQTCQFQGDASLLSRAIGNDCLDVSDYILVGAPLLPFVFVAFVIGAGVVATMRAYYMRLLEEELRSFAGPPFKGSLVLQPASHMELLNNLNSLKRGRLSFRFLILSFFVGVGALMLGITVYVGAQVEPLAQLTMAAIYVPLSGVCIYVAVLGSVGGRQLYLTALEQVDYGRSTVPKADYGPKYVDKQRSLLSYILLPRPEELVKIVFVPLTFLTVGLSSGSLDDVGRLFLLWFVFEYLLYEARYQFNDVRDYARDKDHREAGSRRRLPWADRRDIRRRRVTLSMTFIIARVVAALAIGNWAGEFLTTSLLAALVVLTALPYEILKAHLKRHVTKAPDPDEPAYADGSKTRLCEVDPRDSARPRTAAVAIWLAVGAGYALRGGLGASIAGLPITSLAFILLVTTLFLFGSLFVQLTWVLEAASFCKSTGLWWRVNRPLPGHLAGLLSFAPPAPDPPEGKEGTFQELPSDWSPDPNGVKLLVPMDSSWRTPWNLSLAASLAVAVPAGTRLADPSVGLVGLGAAVAGGVLGATLLVSAKPPMRPVALAGCLAIVAVVAGLAQGLDGGLLVAVWPTAIVTATYVGFRGQSYSDLKRPVEKLVAGLRQVRTPDWVWRLLLGTSVAKSLALGRFDTGPDARGGSVV